MGPNHLSRGLAEPMAEKTLRDFSISSTAIVAIGPNVDVGDVNFELKLLTAVKSKIYAINSCIKTRKMNINSIGRSYY